tara:strand:- start:76 stop:426 length:351 start_codon:yes stop_codon:yes gene_type:complete
MFIELLILFFSGLLFSTNFIEGFMMTEKDEKRMTTDTYNRARNFSNIEYNNNKRADTAIQNATKLLKEVEEIKENQEAAEDEEPEDLQEAELERALAAMESIGNEKKKKKKKKGLF